MNSNYIAISCSAYSLYRLSDTIKIIRTRAQADDAFACPELVLVASVEVARFSGCTPKIARDLGVAEHGMRRHATRLASSGCKCDGEPGLGRVSGSLCYFSGRTTRYKNDEERNKKTTKKFVKVSTIKTGILRDYSRMILSSGRATNPALR